MRLIIFKLSAAWIVGLMLGALAYRAIPDPTPYQDLVYDWGRCLWWA